MSFISWATDSAKWATDPLNQATRVATRLLHRVAKPQAVSADLSKPSVPVTGSGAVLPVVWGTVDLYNPILSWYGGLGYVDSKYRITAQFLLCHGVVELLTMICWDKKPVYGSERGLTNLGEGEGSLFYQNSPAIWPDGSGVVGYGRVYGGGHKDLPNVAVSHLADKPIPAQRGIASVVFEDIRLGSQLTLHSPSFRVVRSGQWINWPWYPSKASLPVGTTTWYIRSSDVWNYSWWNFEGHGWISSFRGFTVTSISPLELTLSFDDSGGPPTGEIIVYFGTRGNPEDQIYRGWYQDAEILRVPLDRVELGLNRVWVVVRDWGGELRHTGGTLRSGGYRDINPVHVVWEILTNPDWGMNLPVSQINDTNFKLVADRVAEESLGGSFQWDGAESLGEFLESTVLAHMDAVLRPGRNDGKLELKLLRRDYPGDLSNLLVLNSSNVVAVSDFVCPELDELPNRVGVRYYDLEGRSENVVYADNPTRSTQQGRVIEVQLSFPGVSRKALAQRIAERELQQLSNADRSCTIEANSEARVLNVGDVFVLDWPTYHPTPLAMRVAEISLGNGTADRVSISAVRDVYDMPATAPDGTV